MANEPGRNDPCPCGGGKKFKKCHGRPSADGENQKSDCICADDAS
ncbi:SEC-C metal-binding domain-containing protein [Paraburkholderia xenovorans]|nr:SEC-C metal-binding domain-containing protein [Paraburkholderia xenovorans]